ncbi:MAG: hypothetical protein ACLRFJ_02035 [Alphaproteobacteria bacterium]
MPELPHKELFPYIHPLQEPKFNIIKKYPFLSDWKTSFSNQYKFVLPKNYLNPKKLEIALNFINTNYNKGDIIANIESARQEYNNHDLAGPLRELTSTNKTDYFWVFETAAFICVNKLIDNQNDSRLISLIYGCFAAANNLKEIWNEREGRRIGAIGRSTKYEKYRQEMYMAWCDFPESRKNNTQMSCNWLLQKHNPNNIKESTIKNWIRKWHKNNL